MFILVDAAQASDDWQFLGELLWCLAQLASRSDFSVCVATPDVAAAAAAATVATMSRRESNGTRRSGSRRARVKSPGAESAILLIQIPEENLAEVQEHIDQHLSADIEAQERAAVAAKIVDKAGGVRLWAEMATAIVNDASSEGVSAEIIISMLDDIAPLRRGSLDDLYAWKLTRSTAAEQRLVLVVMQWVMLAPEPLRLNELLVALRLTLLTCRGEQDGGLWDTSKTLDIEPAMSLKDLRKSDLDDQGIGTAMDSPSMFWKWLQQISQGLLKLESGGGGVMADSRLSSEPLGLQRVQPSHESVKDFFLKGRGFQTLLPPPVKPKARHPSTERFIDTSYYALLHVCLVYLNVAELDSLGRERKPVSAAPGEDLPPEETSKWRQHTEDQRKMIMASYPLLRYIVDNLIFHLLCPRDFRYFLPQRALLQLLSANRCRIWRRWTHLLGFGIADAEPAALLARAGPAAQRLLDPVYGARFRLERVLRKVWKTAVAQQRDGSGHSRSANGTPRRAHFRSRSDVSDRSMVFMLMGGDDPLKAQWMMPTNTVAAEGGGRARAGSSPPGSSPLSPRTLAGIQEVV
ncbi:unnamed protein product [Discula destructiva]